MEKIHNKKFQDLYPSPSTVRMSKQEDRWHTLGSKEYTQDLVAQSHGKSPTEKQQYITRMDF
jgi:hypothetical protein